jgi:hypothetical protein
MGLRKAPQSSKQEQTKMKTTKMIALLAVIVAGLSLGQAASATELVIDLSVAGNKASSNSSLRVDWYSKTSLMFGTGVKFGPFIQYDMPDSADNNPYIMGGNIRLGTTWFFELGLGYAKQGDLKGWGLVPVVGRTFALSSGVDMRIAIPYVYRNYTDPVETKTGDFRPYVGFAFKF